jgi:GntR family transcriptional regulator/MocR family aminotransferase
LIFDNNANWGPEKSRLSNPVRLDVLKTAADKHLDEVLDVEHAAAGIRTLGWLKTWKSDHEAAQQAQKVTVTPE